MASQALTTAPITLYFNNTNLTSTTMSILVNNAVYTLESQTQMVMTGSIAFSALYMTTGMISFSVPSGTTFTGSITVVVSQTGAGSPPTIEVTNFAGQVSVQWPVSSGPPQTQYLTSGEPMTLSNFG